MSILREEAFLSTTKIESLSGVTLGVNRPVKQGDIWPTLPSDGTVPDWGIGFHSCHQVGSVTRLFFAAFSDPNITYIHHGYAEWDGTTLTRPNLGLVSFNGNTNNNLITPGGYTRNQYFTSWDEVGQQYVCMVIVAAGPPRSYAIYTSPSMPPTWTLRKTFSSADFGKDVTDVGNMWRRSDNRAAVYYQDTPASTRHVGMLLGPSDGSLTGTWTDVGRVLTAPSDASQYYYTSAWVDGELVYAAVCTFDGTGGIPPGHTIVGTTNRIWKVQLFVGTAGDGSVLTLVDADWLSSTGVAGEYDGGEIGVSQTIARVGNIWKLPFWGDADTHHQSPELTRHMGMSHLGYRRIGKVSSNGNVTLTAISGGPANVLVTGTSSGAGGIQIELLNSTTGAVLAGYSRTDCDTVGTDVTDAIVTWQGVAATPSTFKIKAYLTNATLNFISVSSAVANAAIGVGDNISTGIGNVTAQTQTPLTITGSSGWLQVGTQLSVAALPNTRVSTAATVVSTSGGTLIFVGADSSKFAFSSNGTTWTSTLVIPSGTSNIYLSVLPVSGDGSLSATVGVPL